MTSKLTAILFAILALVATATAEAQKGPTQAPDAVIHVTITPGFSVLGALQRIANESHGLIKGVRPVGVNLNQLVGKTVEINGIEEISKLIDRELYDWSIDREGYILVTPKNATGAMVSPPPPPPPPPGQVNQPPFVPSMPIPPEPPAPPKLSTQAATTAPIEFGKNTRVYDAIRSIIQIRPDLISDLKRTDVMLDEPIGHDVKFAGLRDLAQIIDQDKYSISIDLNLVLNVAPKGKVKEQVSAIPPPEVVSKAPAANESAPAEEDHPISFEDMRQRLGWPAAIPATQTRQLPPTYEQVQAGLGWFDLPAYRDPYYGSGATYPGGFLNPFGYRDYINQEKYGLLKIDGPDKFLQNVRVLIDGVDVAVASKANNAWNAPILVLAGTHRIEFIRETKDKIQGFWRNYEIVSVAAARGTSGKPISYVRVSGNEFEYGQNVTEYTQHRSVEQ